jgi:hypothetical protein
MKEITSWASSQVMRVPLSCMSVNLENEDEKDPFLSNGNKRLWLLKWTRQELARSVEIAT